MRFPLKMDAFIQTADKTVSQDKVSARQTPELLYNSAKDFGDFSVVCS